MWGCCKGYGQTSRMVRKYQQKLFKRFFSSAAAFGPPPSRPLRRVVVTGLGMVTPLGCGVETTWKHLLAGKCGVRTITPEDLKMDGFDKETQLHTYDQLASKVAAVVPCGNKLGEFNELSWLNSKDHRSIARFIGYALCAADEALRDANWLPNEQHEKEMTGVSIGAGTGSICDMLDASRLICEKRKCCVYVIEDHGSGREKPDCSGLLLAKVAHKVLDDLPQGRGL